MPQWLLENDKYEPIKDKDSFIDKSILSILSILSKLRLKSEKNKAVFSVNANVKVVSVLLIIVLTAVSRSLLFILTVDILLLLIVSFLSIKEIKSILGVCFITTAFTAIILLPSIFAGNGNNSILIVSKVLAAITSVNILSHMTEWNKITSALKMFYIPDIFIFVLDITIKYIFILGELSVNMLYAFRLRTVGRNSDKYASLSGIMGTMFIKSKSMAEEMQSAMECRGFTGEYKSNSKFKLQVKDWLCIMADILLVIMYIFFR